MAKKKKEKHEVIVDDDGGGALILPKGADPMRKKEVEEVYKTIKDEFAKVIRMERHILVLCNGVPAGILSEYERNASYVFAYVPDYDGPPVSLTMPLKKRSFSFDRFPPFFDAFLPEGVNYEEFLRRSKIERDDCMSQLLAAGGHSTISVEDYDKAKEAYLTSLQLPIKGKKKKYPSRDELHDRGGRKKGFDFGETVDKLSAPKPMNPKDLNKWATERNKIDRLARDLRLLGISVFGDSDKFDGWLQTPIPALGNIRPCSLLGTADGIQEVINELYRIEYGVFS